MIDKKFVLSNGMEFMLIPAGRFLMGSAEGVDAFDIERPQHWVDIPYDYWMARFTITNEQYRAFDKPGRLRTFTHTLEKNPTHPVVNIKWAEAVEYCRWLNASFISELPDGLTLRLPTEAEWEKAARGTDGRIYPWGNEFDPGKCHSEDRERTQSGSAPVGMYSPQGDSPFGCADMAGNIWEWTHSLLRSYPYHPEDGREDEAAPGFRVLRGGSFRCDNWGTRCAYRVQGYPFALKLVNEIGFRVALSVKF